MTVMTRESDLMSQLIKLTINAIVVRNLLQEPVKCHNRQKSPV